MISTEFDFAHEDCGSMTVNVTTNNGRTIVYLRVRDGNGYGGGPSVVTMTSDELKTVSKALEVHEKSIMEFAR